MKAVYFFAAYCDQISWNVTLIVFTSDKVTVFLRGMCSSVSTGLFPKNLPGRFLARSLVTVRLCSSQTSWSRRRILQSKPAPAQSYFPACTSDTRRKPLYQTERRGQTLSSFTLHSFGRPLIEREKRDRILTALQQWRLSRCYNYSYEEVSPELPPSHTENLNLYVSMWGKLILHWAQGAVKTEGNEFSGTSHSCIKKERERKCMWIIEILLRWTQWRV